MNSKYLSAPLMATGADPWIIQNDGLYYYCFSDNKSSIFISWAVDPHHLDEAEKKLIWHAAPGEAWSHETWAPELHKLDGLWYIYFAASDGDNSTHRMFVLEAENPLGPYHFKGQISPFTDRWAIDGTVLEIEGSRYFIWSGWDGFTNMQQNLYIAPMENPWTLAPALDEDLPLHALSPGADTLLHAEVFVETAGAFSLEISYNCATTAMHRLELNENTHASLHYHPTGSNHWETYFEKIFLKAGRNIIHLTAGIGKAAIRDIKLRAYGQDRLLLSAPEFGWEKLGGPPFVNEGPTVLQKNGLIHLIYSASASWTDDYQLGLLTFQGGDVLDRRNWIKHGPVFQGTETVFAPGHACFIEYHEQDWIVYHAAKFSGAGWNRQVCMQPFSWNEKGDPNFGSPWTLSEKISG